MNKDEIKDQKPSQDETSRENRILLSDMDAHIHDRMKAQPKNIEEIDLKVEESRDPSVHRLTLPKEIQKFERRFVFRWLMKHKQALDYSCDVRGWTLVNRSYFPDLPRHLFTVSGSVERGDSILAFMAKKKAEKIRREPGEKSTNIIKGTFEKHKGDPRYYAPDSGTKDAEGAQTVMI